jgi:hypothetical protein
MPGKQSVPHWLIHWNGNKYEAMQVVIMDQGDVARVSKYQATTLDELFRLVVSKHGWKLLVEFSPSMQWN